VASHVSKGPTDALRHIDEQRVRTRFFILEELVAPSTKFGLQGYGPDETSQMGPVLRRIADWIPAGIVPDIDLVKSAWRVLNTNGADKPQLLGAVGKMRDCNVIAQAVSLPSKLPRVWPDLKLGLQYLLVIIVARPKHHSMRAKLHRLTITIGRNVFD
jgi:hypothetical protein